MTPKLELGRDFCTTHLATKFHHPVLIIRSYRVDKQTNRRRWKRPSRFVILRRWVTSSRCPHSKRKTAAAINTTLGTHYSTLWQSLGLHRPEGQKVKGQGHTVTKTVMVARLLASGWCGRSAAAAGVGLHVVRLLGFLVHIVPPLLRIICVSCMLYWIDECSYTGPAL